jgi:hypothetical protein
MLCSLSVGHCTYKQRKRECTGDVPVLPVLSSLRVVGPFRSRQWHRKTMIPAALGPRVNIVCTASDGIAECPERCVWRDRRDEEGEEQQTLWSEFLGAD